MERIVRTSDADRAIIRRLIQMEMGRIPATADLRMSLVDQAPVDGKWLITVSHADPQADVLSLDAYKVLTGYCYLQYDEYHHPDVWVTWVLPAQAGLPQEQSNYLPYPPVINWESVLA